MVATSFFFLSFTVHYQRKAKLLKCCHFYKSEHLFQFVVKIKLMKCKLLFCAYFVLVVFSGRCCGFQLIIKGIFQLLKRTSKKPQMV